MKDQAKNGPSSAGMIYTHSRANLPDHVTGELPSEKAVLQALRRVQAKGRPVAANNADDIEIPEEWVRTKSGVPWISPGEDHQGQRFFLLATQEQLSDLVEPGRTIFIDGTFKKSPPQFLELVTMQVITLTCLVIVCLAVTSRWSDL